MDVSEDEREQMSREDEDEEFSSTEDDVQPSVKKLKRKRMSRKMYREMQTSSSTEWDIFQMET